jgi:hypothetical protein
LSKRPERLHKIPIPIQDVKWQKALNSDYLFFFSSKERWVEKAGLYYARIDFSKAGRKEPHKLLDLISENMKLIEDLKAPKNLLVWDVGGNGHVLAVAYSVRGEENKTTSKLMVLTSPEGNFVECDNVDHSGYEVHTIKVIVPFEDNDIVHVIYGLSGGMDVDGH